MRNALKVFRRDVGRILHAPKVWAIVIGLVIMPSMYAWVNILAFWDPYSDTEHVKVAVVNLDEGASTEMTGEVDVGAKIVDQLKANDQLGWRFVGEDAALRGVRSGDYYAAIVIPPTFSADLLSITTGRFVRPELDYYVNEKANAIAPKITGVGASTLDSQVNATFVSTVAETVAEDLEKAGVDTGARLLDARTTTLDALDDTVAELEAARGGLADLQVTLTDAGVALTEATSALTEVDETIGDVQASIAQAQALVDDAQQDLVSFTDSVTTAYVSGATLLSGASARLNVAVTTLSAGVQNANLAIGTAIDDADAIADASAEVLTELEAQLATMDPADPGYSELSEAVDLLRERNASDQHLLGDLATLNQDVADVTTALQATASALNGAVQDSATSAGSIQTALTGTVPEINRTMAELSASAGAFSTALDAQRELVREAVTLLDGLEAQMEQARSAVTLLDGNLLGVEQDLETLRTDLSALSSAEIWRTLSAVTELDPQQVARFMSSPVEVKQHNLFPVATYGSAMAPLFTNLALWIGAFMLVVLLKQEADTEGVPGLTVRQAYLGRWMLLASLNVLQALLVSIGDVVIGVQTASAAAFVATSVFTGLVYVSIIYALAMSLGYVGKGVAILLVIMQIPGASGIYPIEMMPGFFRSLFPFFPFTYGIDAMRETIGGFYDGYYWRYVAVLGLYAVLAFVLGVFLRLRLGNFSRLFNVKLAETGLFVSEDVQIFGSRRRLSQIVQALSDRQRFREKTARRAEWFMKRHLTVIRLAVLIGVGVSVVLLGVAWFVPDAKATVLGLWGVVCLLVIGTVVTIEYVRQNIVFAGKVEDMPESSLRQALAREERATRSDTPLAELQDHGKRS